MTDSTPSVRPGDTDPQRHAEWRAVLIDLFADAVGEDRFLLPADAVRAGVPRRHADAVARISKGITTAAEAVLAADELAHDLVAAEAERAETDTAGPRELAAMVPRGVGAGRRTSWQSSRGGQAR